MSVNPVTPEPREGAASGFPAAGNAIAVRHWAVLAVAVSLLAVTTGATAAQQSPQAGIETQTLEPVAPAQGEAGQGTDQGTGQGLTPSDSRFKPAPFRTLGATSAPELIEPVATAMQGGARLRELDKMTGRTKTFDVATGAETTVDRLRVRLDACRAPDDNSQHGTMAFLEVWDTKRDTPDPVFSGWMFAESPALSAMDHPRYDLWVISCTTSAGETPKASE